MLADVRSSPTAITVPGTGFTKAHSLFRQSVRQFIDQDINPYVDAWEEAEMFPAHEVFKKAGDLGLLGVTYPEEYGGAGADHWYSIALAEELAHVACGGIPMAMSVQTEMATPALNQYGSHELKKQFLEPALLGDAVCSIAVTEPGAGSDVAAIRTKAVRQGDEYVINGNKLYITNGVQADWVCLLARTNPDAGYRGMSLIIVPTDTPGFQVTKKLKKLGNWSSDTAELAFENVRVPVSYRIGEEGMGFIYQMEQFQNERLVSSCGAAAGMEKIIKMTIEYCRGRKTFGKPLIENQWIYFKLTELITEVEMLKQMCYHCGRMMDRGEDYTREASMCKLKAGRLTREVADTCLQFHGGMGYMEEYPMARYFRDSRLWSIGAGADEVMMGI
ncbi:MAG: acyl-CoA dehydrogenase family protein, partial [Planctomycetaceae bacterium]|nr:acyl-CoA dehydrogenase family protein [Planctomycetaceae bacterium]